MSIRPKREQQDGGDLLQPNVLMEENEVPISNSSFGYYQAFSKNAHQFRHEVNMFMDLVIRTKRIWRNLPRSLCIEEKIASNFEGTCWNGSASGSYTKRLARDGVHSQRLNPEYGEEIKFSAKAFDNQRLKLIELKEQLEGPSFDPDVKNSLILVEASLEDDEDLVAEGSGSEETEIEVERVVSTISPVFRPHPKIPIKNSSDSILYPTLKPVVLVLVFIYVFILNNLFQ